MHIEEADLSYHAKRDMHMKSFTFQASVVTPLSFYLSFTKIFFVMNLSSLFQDLADLPDTLFSSIRPMKPAADNALGLTYTGLSIFIIT